MTTKDQANAATTSNSYLMDSDKMKIFRRDILGSKMRITLSDRRVVEGILQCIDKDMNFILGSATEYYNMQSSENSIEVIDPLVSCGVASELVSKYVGMAMVSGQHVTKVLQWKE